MTDAAAQDTDDENRLTERDVIITDSRKAQPKLVQVATWGRYATGTTFLGQLPETVRPPRRNNPPRGV